MTGNVTPDVEKKYSDLKAVLKELGNVLVAFSGGLDSTLLLKVAKDTLGGNVYAVIASSETYPEHERMEAESLAKELDIPYRVIETKELEIESFRKNPPDRCYLCKNELFSKLKKIAGEMDIPYVIDGANLEDEGDYRPGSRAAAELGVRSPLKEAGLVKKDIRTLSKRLGLRTWDKPSFACLASRFPYFTEIKEEALSQVGRAEEFLRGLGFSQVRVRHHGDIARIEINADEIPKILESRLREKITQELKELGYDYITLDLTGYKTGSMNIKIRGETGGAT